jgi:hypothetical protein
MLLALKYHVLHGNDNWIAVNNAGSLLRKIFYSLSKTGPRNDKPHLFTSFPKTWECVFSQFKKCRPSSRDRETQQIYRKHVIFHWLTVTVIRQDLQVDRPDSLPRKFVPKNRKLSRIYTVYCKYNLIAELRVGGSIPCNKAKIWS